MRPSSSSQAATILIAMLFALFVRLASAFQRAYACITGAHITGIKRFQARKAINTNKPLANEILLIASFRRALVVIAGLALTKIFGKRIMWLTTTTRNMRVALLFAPPIYFCVPACVARLAARKVCSRAAPAMWVTRYRFFAAFAGAGAVAFPARAPSTDTLFFSSVSPST